MTESSNTSDTAQLGSEPVAYQFRQRSAVGKGPQSQLPWCDWVCIEREDYERYVREPNKLVQVRPLYAALASQQGGEKAEASAQDAMAQLDVLNAMAATEEADITFLLEQLNHEPTVEAYRKRVKSFRTQTIHVAADIALRSPAETGRNRDPIYAPDGSTWYQTALNLAQSRGDAENRIHELEGQVETSRAQAVEECARIAEAQVQTFLSPEYASNQPFGSICERFACEEVAKAIRGLISSTPRSPTGDTVQTSPQEREAKP